ncbi:LPXTG cell wall anchor domain-containing protein [Affinirhizobium pseudoryzae]|jgi:MYXO-CTERM domain-containing protein|uniref:LPXTG cell wall anchor domain-containing protein n=1 Tax=Allorhizobium pseudoryzae TaxID=379684 RepID=UPI0013E9D0BA|nr:LPXTG cell wall anchor domain-containing protein [Allorhizobium pseudoryzae]
MNILRILLTILAGLCVLMGLVWIGQGTGVFPYPASSFMIDQSPWILWGALLAAAGLAALWLLRRRR